MAVSVIVVDAQPIVWQGMRTLLSRDGRFVLAGVAGTPEEALRLLARHKPQLALIDLLMPGLRGADSLPMLTARSPQTRVIAFCTRAEETFVRQVLHQGAIGYVRKGCEVSLILEAFREALAGRFYLCLPFATCAREASSGADAGPRCDVELSPRERQVLRLVAEGLTSRAIAQRLALSPRTVEMHRAHIMRKLHLCTQTDLIRYALRNGLLS